jgi:hypothetical protein
MNCVRSLAFGAVLDTIYQTVSLEMLNRSVKCVVFQT